MRLKRQDFPIELAQALPGTEQYDEHWSSCEGWELSSGSLQAQDAYHERYIQHKRKENVTQRHDPECTSKIRLLGLSKHKEVGVENSAEEEVDAREEGDQRHDR